jgi:serine/threonine protein kinase/tetratricopeptide (TPR) repeat protein
VGTLQTSEDKLVGRTLPGGYHILDLISVGGMGRVYRAQQSALGRTVAVKIIHPHLLADENSALRFMTEARAASQLNHPNSVSVFDFGRTDDGQPYLVMEFLRGKDLARVSYEEGPLAFARIVDVLRQVLLALGEAHDLGIIHRDLKPENVILEPLRRGGDFVKVVDFGLAKLRADTQTPSVTSPGIVCGTPDYMAPEQGRGDPLDGRSDLYAVGVILFQLLTGRLPFRAENPTQVVMMHLTVPVPDPRQLAPERAIPDALVDVVMKSLAKDASRRYQDALEFADALKQALVLAESLPPPDRLSLAPPSVALGSIPCPSCGSLVPPTRFCGECGTRLPVRSMNPEAGAPSLPLLLVARDEETAFLDEWRNRVRDRLLSVRIAGDPGAGKTRLLHEFLAYARRDGDAVVVTGPDPYRAGVAYHAVREAIQKLANLSSVEVDTGRFTRAPAGVRAGLEEVFGRVPRDSVRSAATRRSGVLSALRWALGLSAENVRRVVLVIDDFDDVDSASRTAFADLLAEPPAIKALLVFAYAPGLDFGWDKLSEERLLGGLPPPAVARLVRSARGGDRLRLPEGLRGALPMYVEQVIRYTLEGGSDPPARLADLIALRVDSLEPMARRVLQALAVLGDRVRPEAVAELLPRTEQLEPAIDALVRAGMVERDEVLSTAHPLLREIVIAGIPVAVRRDLHRKALDESEKVGAPIEVSAFHACEAGDSFQALLLLEQVAERSFNRGDAKAEVLALRRGLEIARQEIARGELDDPLRAMLIFGQKLGAALTRTGNFSDAEGVLREALDIAGPNGPDRAKVLSALAHVAHGRQRAGEAAGFIEQAIEVAQRSGAFDLVSQYHDTRRAWG